MKQDTAMNSDLSRAANAYRTYPKLEGKYSATVGFGTNAGKEYVCYTVGERWFFYHGKNTSLGKIVGVTGANITLEGTEDYGVGLRFTNRITVKPQSLITRAPKRWWNPFDK